MVMCEPNCCCRFCDIANMACHPAFRARIDDMVQEYKRLIIGPSFFLIELADAKVLEEGS